MNVNAVDVLRERGFVKQCSGEVGLRNLFAKKKTSCFILVLTRQLAVFILEAWFQLWQWPICKRRATPQFALLAEARR